MLFTIIRNHANQEVNSGENVGLKIVNGLADV